MKIDLRLFFQSFVSAQKAAEQKITRRLRLARERQTSHSNDNNGPIKNNIYTLHFVLSGAAARPSGRNRFRKSIFFTLTAARVL